MKLFNILLLMLVTVGCVASPPPVAKINEFVLHSVNVLDVVNRKLLQNQSVWVRDGVIQQVTANNADTLPTGVHQIDGAGGFVTPGLIDMHVHMYEPAAYTIALSHGVTHVRVMNGIAQQLAWRDAVQRGELIGASSTVSSPIISAYDAMLHHTVHTADEAREAVREYRAQGYDVIKAYGNLSEEALLALVDEAKKRNIPVAKHGPHASGELPVSTMTGLQSFEHVEDIFQGPLKYQFAPQALPEIIEQLKTTQVPVTPTLNIFYQLTKLSEEKQDFLDSIPQDYTSDIIALEAKNNQVQRWLDASENMAQHNRRTLAFLGDITGQLHKNGVALLVGSDSGVLLSPHGLATHSEMALLQQAGLDNFAVLAAATINPTKALGLSDTLGIVATGYQADFIYSKQNPLEDLAVLKNPDAVTKQGVWYNSNTLITLRTDAIKNRSLWAELSALWQAL